MPRLPDAALLETPRRSARSDAWGSVANVRELPRASLISVGAACAYVVGFTLPLPYDLPLLGLAVAGGAVALLDPRGRRAVAAHLLLPVMVFVLAAGASIVVSEDMARSGQLSVPLLPGLLLFLIIAGQFAGSEDVRALFRTFSTVALGLALLLVATAWANAGAEPSALIARVGSPVLLVPNDCAFLAVIAPLSLALLCCPGPGAGGLAAALSLIASICAMCVLQSRVAMLTTLISLSCVAGLLRPRLALRGGLLLVALAVAVDGARGFPLAAKFMGFKDPRIALWLVALAMFRDAPILGHGAHTFGVLRGSYLPTLDLPGWLPVDARGVPWAHNLYLETLAEQGIVGLFALVLLLGSGVAAAWKCRTTSAGDARVLATGAMAALIALSVAGVFEISFVRQWVVVVTFALLGVVARLAAVQPQTTEVQQ